MRWWDLVCVSAREEIRFPSVLHPPPLAREFRASYGEMSRRSGDLSAVARSAEVEAAKEDNHSSPFRINDLEATGTAVSLNCVSDLSICCNHLRALGVCGRRLRIPSYVMLESKSGYNRSMKTTIDIPENELRDAMRFTQATTKREAVVKVLEEFNRRRRMAELVKYAGTFSDQFPTNDEIETIDAKRDRKVYARPRR